MASFAAPSLNASSALEKKNNQNSADPQISGGNHKGIINKIDEEALEGSSSCVSNAKSR